MCPNVLLQDAQAHVVCLYAQSRLETSGKKYFCPSQFFYLAL